jgi:hypothetical protein
MFAIKTFLNKKKKAIAEDKPIPNPTEKERNASHTLRLLFFL